MTSLIEEGLCKNVHNGVGERCPPDTQHGGANPLSALNTWNYALNNLRAAFRHSGTPVNLYPSAYPFVFICVYIWWLLVSPENGHCVIWRGLEFGAWAHRFQAPGPRARGAGAPEFHEIVICRLAYLPN